jgi:ribosome-binding factor A
MLQRLPVVTLIASCTLLLLATVSHGFTTPSHLLQQQQRQNVVAPLPMASLASRHYSKGGNNNRRGGDEKSKRQERVGQLVKTELSSILHTGIIKGRDADYLDDDLRQRISVVNADISPDLKQARISISVRGPNKHKDTEEEEAYNPAVDKRRAYSWLVRNTKPIRHTLAQKMSHMKSCPNLSFVQVDVAAATDVMYLIDKVASGYKREKIGGVGENDMPTGILDGIDYDDEDFDDDEWDEEDDDFFSN